MAHNSVGWYHAQLGQYGSARNHCETALAMHRTRDSADGEATTLESLGVIAHGEHRFTAAIEYFHEALSRFEALGNTYKQADVLDHLARSHSAVNDFVPAQQTWQRALDLFQAQYRVARADAVHKELAVVTNGTAPGTG